MWLNLARLDCPVCLLKQLTNVHVCGHLFNPWKWSRWSVLDSDIMQRIVLEYYFWQTLIMLTVPRGCRVQRWCCASKDHVPLWYVPRDVVFFSVTQLSDDCYYIFFHVTGEEVVEALGSEVDRLEKEIQKIVPGIRHVDIEAHNPKGPSPWSMASVICILGPIHFHI